MIRSMEHDFRQSDAAFGLFYFLYAVCYASGSLVSGLLTERVGRLSPRSINEAFVAAREEAGLHPSLDLHCLRHSYITHLTEFGYPARFVQEQVGHSHGSTTAIYMGVSNEYRNKLLEAALKGRLGDDWDVTE